MSAQAGPGLAGIVWTPKNIAVASGLGVVTVALIVVIVLFAVGVIKVGGAAAPAAPAPPAAVTASSLEGHWLVTDGSRHTTACIEKGRLYTPGHPGVVVHRAGTLLTLTTPSGTVLSTGSVSADNRTIEQKSGKGVTTTLTRIGPGCPSAQGLIDLDGYWSTEFGGACIDNGLVRPYSTAPAGSLARSGNVVTFHQHSAVYHGLVSADNNKIVFTKVGGHPATWTRTASSCPPLRTLSSLDGKWRAPDGSVHTVKNGVAPTHPARFTRSGNTVAQVPKRHEAQGARTATGTVNDTNDVMTFPSDFGPQQWVRLGSEFDGEFY